MPSYAELRLVAPARFGEYGAPTVLAFPVVMVPAARLPEIRNPVWVVETIVVRESSQIARPAPVMSASLPVPRGSIVPHAADVPLVLAAATTSQPSLPHSQPTSFANAPIDGSAVPFESMVITLASVGISGVPGAVAPRFLANPGMPVDPPLPEPDRLDPSQAGNAAPPDESSSEPGGATAVTLIAEPGGADLITRFLPGDPRLIEAAVANLFDQMEDLGRSVQESTTESPTIVPLVVAALTLELARRYRRRSKLRVQPVAVFGNSTPYRFS